MGRFKLTISGQEGTARMKKVHVGYKKYKNKFDLIQQAEKNEEKIEIELNISKSLEKSHQIISEIRWTNN